MKDLGKYFDETEGLGVLATADKTGKVDTAIYARPHSTGENRLAFIMSDRLSHANVKANPRASYLFVEHEEGYHGKRLMLTMVDEEEDPQSIDTLRRSRGGRGCAKSGEKLYLVHFHVDEVRPLVGDGSED